MFLEIITPQGILFSGDVVSASLPGTAGRFTILNHHAPIVSVLEAGKVLVETETDKQEFEIAGGFVEQHDNNIIICAE